MGVCVECKGPLEDGVLRCGRCHTSARYSTMLSAVDPDLAVPFHEILKREKSLAPALGLDAAAPLQDWQARLFQAMSTSRNPVNSYRAGLEALAGFLHLPADVSETPVPVLERSILDAIGAFGPDFADRFTDRTKKTDKKDRVVDNLTQAVKGGVIMNVLPTRLILPSWFGGVMGLVGLSQLASALLTQSSFDLLRTIPALQEICHHRHLASAAPGDTTPSPESGAGDAVPVEPAPSGPQESKLGVRRIQEIPGILLYVGVGTALPGGSQPLPKSLSTSVYSALLQGMPELHEIVGPSESLDVAWSPRSLAGLQVDDLADKQAFEAASQFVAMLACQASLARLDTPLQAIRERLTGLGELLLDREIASMRGTIAYAREFVDRVVKGGVLGTGELQRLEDSLEEVHKRGLECREYVLQRLDSLGRSLGQATRGSLERLLGDLPVACGTGVMALACQAEAVALGSSLPEKALFKKRLGDLRTARAALEDAFDEGVRCIPGSLAVDPGVLRMVGVQARECEGFRRSLDVVFEESRRAVEQCDLPVVLRLVLGEDGSLEQGYLVPPDYSLDG